MRISILTPSYNQGKFIEKTITSVMNQNWQDVEHIIIDGGSTDNTIDILKRYPHLRWISEPDEGQADALNKGLEIATGEIIGWINSDDFYKENIFNDVIKEFRHGDVKWVIGNITLIYSEVRIIKKNKSPKITHQTLLKNPDIVRQQATFFRKDALAKVGGWNNKYYMTMDYDLWIKLSKKYKPKMINREWAFFTHHEDQKSTAKNILTQLNDIKDILRKEHVSWANINKVVFKKYYYFIKSLIKNLLIDFKLMDSKYRNLPVSLIKNNNKTMKFKSMF
ncbi:Glycosyltransferase involved in cell wall bisynthesis [Candidatus Methanophagaceae archaeon]|nr:Glycosyltransferase involved in cell wall bisynthesis [Methanophagales archaeon]